VKSRSGFVNNSSSSSFTITSTLEFSLYEKAIMAVTKDLVEQGHSFEEAVSLAEKPENIEYTRGDV
jgi:hypothetical protein